MNTTVYLQGRRDDRSVCSNQTKDLFKETSFSFINKIKNNLSATSLILTRIYTHTQSGKRKEKKKNITYVIYFCDTKDIKKRRDMADLFFLLFFFYRRIISQALPCMNLIHSQVLGL